MTKLRIGTRGSVLARAQTAWVARAIEAANPGVACELIIVKTRGDRDRTSALASFGGVGVFVKELESHLIANDIDVAVHSLKDMPCAMTPGLVIAAIPERAPAGDMFLSAKYCSVESCPPGTKIGTGSARRAAQLRWANPGLEIVPIRGNIDTRIDRVRRGEVDATVLAEAGLSRVGMDLACGLHVQPLPTREWVPAPAQGALAVQVRSQDERIVDKVAKIDHSVSRACIEAERSFLAAVGGGCHQPIAAHGSFRAGKVRLSVLIARDETSLVVTLAGTQGAEESTVALGERLAAEVGLWFSTEDED